ncbi:MAG: NAD(P)H-quinone oxidoreductase [Pseudomonadota bacterium]|nr:NAD(P)H-quinone oxidoreductase [Pseudomonadota bacterium]
MRCIEIPAFGPPEVLRESLRPLPQAGPGQVLVRVQAAGVNRPDCLQRAGHYPVPPGASDLPGLEIAGSVIAHGAGDAAAMPALGSQVCALVQGGGYAEYCVADAALCLPIPAGLDAVEAACLPETCFTVWSNVFDRARLAEGETLLVQGGASGIGTTAVQMAHALGHRVFATAGSDDKCRAVEALGAERAINYRSEDFVAVVRELTGGRGVDVVLDMVAGDYLQREVKALADDGRIVLIAFLGGARAQVDFGEVMRRRITITGSTLRPRPVAFKAAIARALEKHVWPLIAQGRMRPLLHARFPLAQAAAAHALMESSAHTGKIVLTLD